MPCAAANPLAIAKGETVVDYTKTHPYVPKKGIFRPDNLRELVRCVQQAEADAGSIRAQGSGYSLSTAAVGDDFLIITDSLNKWLSRPHHSPPNLTNPNWFRSDAHHRDLLTQLARPNFKLNKDSFLIHVEAGIKIKDLLAQLHEAGLGLFTMGAGGGQSLAGAMSTGTHGSDFLLRPLFDFVRAIHLVGPGGQEWWIEPSAGFAKGAELDQLPGWCAETKVVRDDDFFHAPIVAVGRCGVIYSVVLEVSRQFRLFDTSDKKASWKAVRTALRNSVTRNDDGSVSLMGTFKKASPQPDKAPLRFYQVTVDIARGELCWVTRRWVTKKKGAHNISKPNPSTFDAILCTKPDAFGPMIAVLHNSPPIAALKFALGATPFIGPAWVVAIDAYFIELIAMAATSSTVGDFLARVIERTRRLTDAEVGAAGQLADLVLEASSWVIDAEHDPERWGFSHEIVDGHPDKRRGCIGAHSAEFFFDASSDDYLDFMKELLALSANEGGIPGYASLRFTGQSECLLAMERFPLTVAIEIAVPRRLTKDGDLFESFTNAMHTLARKYRGIPHWGQRHKLDVEHVEQLYGESLETWRYALGELERGHSRELFSTAFSRARGLESLDPTLVDRVRTERDAGALVCMLAPMQCG